jgi:hypothetical protein
MKKKSLEAFETTQMHSYCLATLLIAEKFLKYKDNPVGMIQDPDCEIFCEPFKKYVMDQITFEEAQEEFNPLWEKRINDLRDSIHLKIIRAAHEKKTGREFEEDLSVLHSGDEKTKKEAAINLVLTFPEAYHMNENIKALKKQAAIDGDMEFLNSSWDAYHDSQPDVRRDLSLLLRGA